MQVLKVHILLRISYIYMHTKHNGTEIHVYDMSRPDGKIP